MIKKIFLLFLFLSVFSKIAFCGTDIEMGKAAEGAGKYREALTRYIGAAQSSAEGSAEHKEAMAHYLSALKLVTEASRDDRGLRKGVAHIVHKINPSPVISDEAVMLEGRAEAAAKPVQAPEETAIDAFEYKQAFERAPWSAGYYFNRGLVLEKSGAYREAIESFRLYLLSMPDAGDAREAKKKIGALQFQLEKSTGPRV